MKKYDVIVIGGGLAGLSTAYELVNKGKTVLVIEKESFLGGRTASWDDNGMIVESGFHRHIGFYKELPKLLSKVNVKINDIVMWEKQIDIRIIKGKHKLVLGIAPFYGPIKFITGMVGNSDILSLKDKMSLVNFFAAGFKDYVFKPKSLDDYSVVDYAIRHRVTQNVLAYILTSLSTGIFFLPPNEYSAKVFFGLFAPGLPRVPKLRIGAYLGGMTDILANPIAEGIRAKGGEIILSTEVISLVIDNNKVVGVELKSSNKIYADDVVLATDISNAKKILNKISLNQTWVKSITRIPTMSALTIQLDLSKPSLPYDRTTFGPQTMLTSFAEQSRSTFKHTPGRLSVIIADPKRYIDTDDEVIYNQILKEANKLGIKLKGIVTDYRVIRERDKFYHLGPRHDWMRPHQKTPVTGLTLAGDYTRQPLYATMEGAVISGQRAASNIIDDYKIKKN